MGIALIWSLSGILPLIAVNSQFVYYAYYPALGLSMTVSALLLMMWNRWSTTPGRVLQITFLLGLVGALLVGAGYKHHESHHDAHSIRRGVEYLKRIESDLKRMHPTFPAGSRCYFWRVPEHIGFLISDGPSLRVWYNDPTLEGRFLSEYRPDAQRPSYFFLHEENGHPMEIIRGPADPYLKSPHPAYADGHNDLGTCFARVGEHEAAITEWRKAIAVKPEHTHANANLGILLAQMGRFQEAIPILERAVILDPSNVGAKLHLRLALEGHAPGSTH